MRLPSSQVRPTRCSVSSECVSLLPDEPLDLAADEGDRHRDLEVDRLGHAVAGRSATSTGAGDLAGLPGMRDGDVAVRRRGPALLPGGPDLVCRRTSSRSRDPVSALGLVDGHRGAVDVTSRFSTSSWASHTASRKAGVISMPVTCSTVAPGELGVPASGRHSRDPVVRRARVPSALTSTVAPNGAARLDAPPGRADPVGRVPGRCSRPSGSPPPPTRRSPPRCARPPTTATSVRRRLGARRGAAPARRARREPGGPGTW